MVKNQPFKLRIVDTPQGPLTYIMVRKPVKNLNLRIGTEKEIKVSVPLCCPVTQADEFVCEKSGWILDTFSRQDPKRAELLPPASMEEYKKRLEEALVRVYPLVATLGVAFPILKLRKLKSQWGNCHWAQGYITLNLALARCPEELRDYVALHELVHFLHHDHGAGFYFQMDALMPDWRQRRKLLKGFGRVPEWQQTVE